MRAAEFLRGIANMMSAMEDDKPLQAPVVVNVNNITNDTEVSKPAEPARPDQIAIDAVKHVHHHELEADPELKEKPVMVPPLQQKLELMKKMAGIPNQFTAVAADEDEPFDG